MSVITITSQNFETEVINSDKVVLLDFWASWCGPCRMLSPVLDEISDEGGDIKVAKINVDEELQLAERVSVHSIPTIVVMQRGNVKNTAVGVLPKENILKLL